DREWIHCYVEMPERGRDSQGRFSSGKRYEEAVEPYRNSFGQVPIVIFPGTYRPKAKMDRRYEGLAWPLFETERDMNLIDSIIATIGANRRWASPRPQNPNAMPDQATGEGVDIAFFDKEGNPTIPATQAELQDVSNTIPPEL